ncbi:MAG: hypothetical protein QW331_00550 [Candidatus Woesearchaeota archaeon]
MKCLDTYALVEISRENSNFLNLLEGDFLVPNVVLAEFCSIIFREYNESTANYWYGKFLPYTADVPIDVLVKAMIFKIQNKSKNFSFFDSVGYIFSITNNYKFVTGGEGFKGMKGVVFRK